MINRWIGIATLALMLSVNTALVLRDLMPDWMAGEPPTSRALDLRPDDEIYAQLGIYDREGGRVGYSWSDCKRTDGLVSVQHLTVITSLKLPIETKLPVVGIDTIMHYHGQTSLDDMRIKVVGLGIPILLEGEFFPPDDFACKWQVAEQRGEFVIPGESTRALGDMIRPFESLTGLSVGKSWRVRLLNPLSGIIPDWGVKNMMTDEMLVKVTRTEEIEHRGVVVEAFVVESERLRAWVTPAGLVVRQEFDLPLMGKLILVDEPYDEDLRRKIISGSSVR